MHDTLKKSSDKLYGTPVERLIALFSMRNDVSFIYVMHGINSGCVTYRKNKYDTNLDNVPRKGDEHIYVYKYEVSTWRKQSKMVDEDQLRVAFVWCNDDELRAARMFPEFMGCDTTFGVKK